MTFFIKLSYHKQTMLKVLYLDPQTPMRHIKGEKELVTCEDYDW